MSAKKHILFLTQMLPWPLDSGAKVRAYYMLRHLAERHAVMLLALARESDPPFASDHLSRLCNGVGVAILRRSWVKDLVAGLFSLFSGVPALIFRDRHAGFRALIEANVETHSFDAIHTDQIKTAQHAEQITSVPRLIDLHNVYYEMLEGIARLTRSRFRRRMLRHEARQMARYEANRCGAFDEILAVTEDNALRLRRMVQGQRPVTAIPICVDPAQTPMVAPAPDARDVLCVGAMFYPPNVDGVVWFGREILPLVRGEVPEARFRIVGPRPDPAIVNLIAGDPFLHLAGRADDLTPHYQAARVAVVPLRAGSGMRVKILDAMVRGVPVVSTRLGAEGIDARDGEHLLLADEPAAFARAVVRLFRDNQLRKSLIRNARRLIEREYDWRTRYAEVDAVYERLFAAGGRTR